MKFPKYYYNLASIMGASMPPTLHPVTKEPISPGDLAGLFPMELIRQEASMQKHIEIPDELRKRYMAYRPTPLVRALRLEKFLDTPARIYYKYEGATPTGSHKINTALAQAYYNKLEGTERVVTETGAGQWGTALSYACCQFGIGCEVFMVRSSFMQKPYRKTIIKAFGADIHPSPSALTEAGNAILRKDPDSGGSLGIAISEAVETALKDEGTKYALGSVLNHVLLHQTIIGQEVREQFRGIPDVIIGCVGGGSNFAGISFPFIEDKLGGKDIQFIAVEPKSCASITQGGYRYDYGDSAMLTPLMKMHTLGCAFIPPHIHAGGLRYHGMAPLVSLLYERKLIDAVAYGQEEVFEAALAFARTEGIIPAPESAHAIKAAIDKAVECRQKRQRRSIIFNLSGHGHFDLSAYEDYLEGKLFN